MQRGRISTLSPDEIRQRIRDSNEQSANRTAKYVSWEKCAVSNDYELIACHCREGCWCKRNACAGHYRVKEITFETFFATYVKLWIPANSRRNVTGAVLDGLSFKGRQKSAVEP